jgi:EAL domain-containing protein (putative c-di-GMP-specific phosphodiesterase class I)
MTDPRGTSHDPRDGARFRSTGVDLPHDLLGAADRGEMLAYFQPQFDVATLEMVAVEALCRWRHPTLGLIAPDLFIGIAEQSEAIHEIGAFMIDAACGLAAELKKQQIELDVSLNVSVAQLVSPAACELLVDQVARRGIDPSRITVEVTESVEILDVPAVVAHLGLLRDKGIGVSIDDFGTGHSSRDQVLQLPVTEIKLDRSIVQDLPQASLAREALTLAGQRGLRVVAEGVETTEQLERVRALGCDRAQGFLWGRPQPRELVTSSILAAVAS